MPDTVQTRSELITATADNTTGAITAQTIRNMIVSNLFFRGSHNSSTNYVVNDLVIFSGTAYVATAPNTNSTPPNTDWTPLASAGVTLPIAESDVTNLTTDLAAKADTSALAGYMPVDATISYATNATNLYTANPSGVSDLMIDGTGIHNANASLSFDGNNAYFSNDAYFANDIYSTSLWTSGVNMGLLSLTSIGLQNNLSGQWLIDFTQSVNPFSLISFDSANDVYISGSTTYMGSLSAYAITATYIDTTRQSLWNPSNDPVIDWSGVQCFWACLSFENGNAFFGTDVTVGRNLSVSTTATAANFVGNGNKITRTINAVTAAYTVTTTDSIVFASNVSVSPYNITLPATTTYGLGRELTLKKTDANTHPILVAGSGGQQIDGVNVYGLAVQFKYITLVACSNNWSIIANN